MIGLNHYRNGVVRVTHKPTGIYAQCDIDRSQHRNRARALEILRARMYAVANVERVEVIVRNYDLPDGAIVIPDAMLDAIESRAPPPTPCECAGKGCPVCAPTEDGPGQDDKECEL